MSQSTNHAASQQRYAEKLRERGAPRADQIGRAMIKAAARCAPADMNSELGKLWRHWMAVTIDELQKAGFDREESTACLRATLIERRRRCK